MQSRTITPLEYSMVDGKVEIVRKRHNLPKKSTAFLYLLASILFPDSEDALSTIVTDGPQDRGADAIYIRVEGEYAQLNVIQAKYSNSISSADSNFPGGEIDKLISLIHDIIDRSEDALASANAQVASRMRDVWRLVDDAKTLRIRLIFASNSRPLIKHERDRIEAFCKQYQIVSFEEVPFWTVSSLLSAESRPKENGTLDCIDTQKFERIDCDIRGLIANVDAVSFIKMISDEDGESINRHLFEENIRGYLGIEGGFNRRIQSSAVSDDNHLFWYLNNGITIVAKDFSHSPVRGSKIKLTDFQIVNGAQTSYSLLQAYRQKPDRFNQLVLLVKIFASARDDISERIAIATNSQARISPRDLKANDQIQKRIAVALADNGIVYERKRNQFLEKSDRVIDSLKLGQAILAYRLSEPHLAKTASDEIFDSQYNRIFSDALDASYLVSLSKLYFYTNERLSLQIDILRNKASSEAEEFVAYALWHILYCIKLFAERDNKSLPEESEFEIYFDLALEVVGNIAKTYRTESFYRVFRSARTRDIILHNLGLGQLKFDFY